MSEDRSFFTAICAVGFFAILSSTISKNPVLPLLTSSLGTKDLDLGLIAAASTVPGIIISLPAGTLSDALGRRRVIAFACALFASAPLLYFLVRTPWQLALVQFYHGFATAIFGPVANASIADRFPRRRGERLSTFSSATMVGRSFAPFLGGSLIYATGFLSVYLVAGVSGTAAFLIALRALKEPGEGRRPSLSPSKPKAWGIGGFLKAWRAVSGNYKVLLTSGVEATLFFTFGAFEFFLVLYAHSLQISDLLIGLISGAQIVSVAVSKPFMGRISDRVLFRTFRAGGSMARPWASLAPLWT